MYKGLPEKGERADRHEERGRESRTSAVEFNIPYPDQKIKGRSQGWNSMEIRMLHGTNDIQWMVMSL